MKIRQDIHIPDNIAEYIGTHSGIVVTVSINSTDAINGYGQKEWFGVEVKALNRHCIRCGYDRLWNPDDTESKCQRHTYSSEQYDTIFTYLENGAKVSLQEAFDIWLEAQPKESEYWMPTVKMNFGHGWR